MPRRYMHPAFCRRLSRHWQFSRPVQHLLANRLRLLSYALCRVSRCFSCKLSYWRISLLIALRSVSILQGAWVVETNKEIVVSWRIEFWSRVTSQTQEVLSGTTRMSSLLLLCPANNYDSIRWPRNQILGKRYAPMLHRSHPRLPLSPSCSYLTQWSQLASQAPNSLFLGTFVGRAI